jgi:hypothetical protein
MLRILIPAACLATAFLTACPAFAVDTLVVEGEEHCVVNVATWDRLNVRDEPSSSGATATAIAASWSPAARTAAGT